MGASFTNCQVRASSASAVRDAVKSLSRARAYVSPVKNGWVTVYDEASEDQDQSKICSLAEELSKKFKTDVFAFLVHDSDIAMYWLYRCGELADEFNSCPNYFNRDNDENSEDGSGGRTEVLLSICQEGVTPKQIEDILHPKDGYPLMAEEILRELGTLLGIDDNRIGLGFEYFDADAENILPDCADFFPVGEQAGKKQAKPTAIASSTANLPDEHFHFDLAVGMLTKVWDAKFAQSISDAFLQMSGKTREAFAKEMKSGFDRGARDFYKHSKLPGQPSLDELKSARDKGPKALAELLASRVPERMPPIAIAAVQNGFEEFLVALLEQGLDPNAKDFRGFSPLSVAEQNAKGSKIHQLLKNWPAK